MKKEQAKIVRSCRGLGVESNKKLFSEPIILLHDLSTETVIMTSGVGVEWNSKWGDDWDHYNTD